MDITQINTLEVLAISFALFKGYKSPFVLAVFVHVLSITLIVNILLSFLVPSESYYAHVAFYFYMAITCFASCILFACLKEIQSKILSIAISIQGLMCLLIAFSEVNAGPFTFPNFDFVFAIAHFINSSVVTLEVLLTYHYIGGKRKSYN